MIDYKRTNWYGLTYLWRLRGSLLPHCLPAMVLAGALAGVFASPWLEDSLGLVTELLFVDKYSMQLFGVVFGYLAVARLNVSYNRYWEGATQIKNMYSKWADACSQIILFDRVKDAASDVSHDTFCVYIVRLFLQLSAIATVTLHLEREEAQALLARLQRQLEEAEAADELAANAETTAAERPAACTPAEGHADRHVLRARDVGDERRRLSLRNAPQLTKPKAPKHFTQRPRHEDWLRRRLAHADTFLRRHVRRASSQHGEISAPSEMSRRRQDSTMKELANLNPVDYTGKALELDTCAPPPRWHCL